MKHLKITVFFLLVPLILLAQAIYAQSWIRINQLGYLPQSIKAAVLCSKQDISPKQFELCDAFTRKVVSIYNNLKGIRLTRPDTFRQFQSHVAVYHDDYSDYSTNEPTLDGTASLLYYLSALQKEGRNPGF